MASEHDENIRFTFADTDEDGDETGDMIEVELTIDQAQPFTATSYIVDDKAPLLSNEDGTVTRLDSAVPDPTEKKNS
jgi:hypothetical protein